MNGTNLESLTLEENTDNGTNVNIKGKEILNFWLNLASIITYVTNVLRSIAKGIYHSVYFTPEDGMNLSFSLQICSKL